MTSGTPLDDWLFLIGEWRGKSKESQFGGEGVVETSDTYTLEMNGIYIMGRHKSVRDGKIEHEGISIMFYDKRNKKVLRKTFFSYGFVNNEVEFERTEDFLHFDVVIEPVPQAFDGMKWRSYLRKVSNTETRDGLESAKSGEDFENYGEVVSKKIS
ncbi:MAG: hypothetical protein ACXACG_00895 [Candidatus Thorarchaeota archaeon]|jgi:hypothetical protein